MLNHRDFHIVIIDSDMGQNNAPGHGIAEVMERLEEEEFSISTASTARDGIAIFLSHTMCCAILLDWDLTGESKGHHATNVIDAIRARNDKIPIFIMTSKHTVQEIPTEIMSKVSGYVWILEDTPHFIAGRVEQAATRYIDHLLPPFFEELVHYTYEYKYSWHTPGHSGGLAFLKSPPGHIFFDFMGENTLRSDLSVSVPELGSLMEHSGPVGAAEAAAAKAFGAEQTYFVTNGTSTSNKMVWNGSVVPGDVVLVDRNCHKSIMHAIIMTGAKPVYFIPTRNDYGIIGPIHISEFEPETIRKKIEACPFIEDKNTPVTLAVVTNSTYDGLCYNTVPIKERLGGLVENLHFDEAWFGYARFHPIYKNHFGMCDEHDPENHPAIFATQSTHKLLASLSQGSMVHVKSGRRKVEFDRFNEAFMMHTSTSPQYGIIASLDVATKMMEGTAGHALVDDSIDEAVIFRKKMVMTAKDTAKIEKDPAKKWWFGIWQPDKVIAKSDDSSLENRQEHWVLGPKESWHGFANMEPNYIMLDPIKVTVITPGITGDGTMSEFGIPAGLVSRFLWSRGVVVEKTGFYSFLILFSIGITKGKSGTLLAELADFKALHDRNAPLEEVFPDLVEMHPERYAGLGLADFAHEMHEHLVRENITQVSQNVYATLPDQKMIPAKAYEQIVHSNTELVPLSELMGRIPAVMLVPYPPGIPIIMPGEQFNEKAKGIVDYLRVYEDFDNAFPGFETETHGIELKNEGGRVRYYTSCIKA